jgi:hypothetical protein
MARNIAVEELPERVAFDLKLQIALRKNAISIKENSKHPEKFDEYIQERENKIRKLLDTKDEIIVTEQGRVIFSSSNMDNGLIQKG